MYAKHSVKAQGGNCGEHTSDALMRLLQAKLHFGLPMKIQTVYVDTPSFDHIYLLLDSNINDVRIVSDPELVRKTLDSITKGKICDPWNKGYYADFHTDDSNFYNSKAGWSRLVVKTYDLKFAHFNKLTHEAKHYICDELSQIGLNIEPKRVCSSIFNHNGGQTKQIVIPHVRADRDAEKHLTKAILHL